jgi:hypothetical protein
VCCQKVFKTLDDNMSTAIARLRINTSACGKTADHDVNELLFERTAHFRMLHNVRRIVRQLTNELVHSTAVMATIGTGASRRRDHGVVASPIALTPWPAAPSRDRFSFAIVWQASVDRVGNDEYHDAHDRSGDERAGMPT